MKKLVFGGITFVMLAMVVLAGCGPSKEVKAEQAKAAALTAFGIVRSPVPGHVAGTSAERIYNTLTDAGLGYDAIGTTPQEVSRYVREAYARDVSEGLADLRATKANANAARAHKASILEALGLSGRSLASFQTSEAMLDLSIQRNLLEEAKAQGQPLTPAAYRAAGLPPNRIVVIKRVPMRVVRKPATKLARR